MHLLLLLVIHVTTWTRSTIIVWVMIVSSRFIRRNTVISSHFAARLPLPCLIRNNWSIGSLSITPIRIFLHILNLMLDWGLSWLGLSLIARKKRVLVTFDALLTLIIAFYLSIPCVWVNIDVNHCVTTLCRCCNLMLRLGVISSFLNNLLWIKRVKLYLILCLKRRLVIFLKAYKLWCIFCHLMKLLWSVEIRSLRLILLR